MEELDILRLKTKKRITVTTLILFVICTLISYVLFGMFIGYPENIWDSTDQLLKVLLIVVPILDGVIFAIIISSWMTRGIRREYKEAFLELFVKKEFEMHFSDVEVSSFGLKDTIIFGEGLLRRGNRYDSNDSISGTYKGLHFNKCDVLIQQVTSTGKTTTTTTYFNGQVILVEGLGKVVDRIYIQNESLKCENKNGFFSKKEFEKVDTESLTFNERYKVFAIDPHDAFYILTPHVMERFITFPKSKGFGVSLHDTQALLALDSGRDSIDASIRKAIDHREIQKVQDDIQAIRLTIDLLIEAESMGD